jgi:hypothetical protein
MSFCTKTWPQAHETNQVAQQSVTQIITVTIMNLVTPKSWSQA